MARVELIMPKMGESVSEATVICWKKEVGEMVELDETIIEIATDKVDSEIPSTYEGKLVERLFKEDDIVKVGQPFAILETKDGEDTPIADNVTPTPIAAKIVEETKSDQKKEEFEIKIDNYGKFNLTNAGVMEVPYPIHESI